MDFKRGKGVVAQARLVILNVYSFFCGERDDLERLYILNDIHLFNTMCAETS